MKSIENIKAYCGRLKLAYTPNKINNIIMEAQQNKPTYIEFLEKVLYEETRARGLQRIFAETTCRQTSTTV